MSGKREKAKRRQKKIQATRFARELDNMEAKLWKKHKQANPHIKCNAEFQAKVNEDSRLNNHLQ